MFSSFLQRDVLVKPAVEEVSQKPSTPEVKDGAVDTQSRSPRSKPKHLQQEELLEKRGVLPAFLKQRASSPKVRNYQSVQLSTCYPIRV